MPHPQTSAPPDTALHTLARRVGILPEYVDQSGRERRTTSDETRIALLAAMGLDGSSEATARATLDRLTETERARLLEPVRVVRGPGAVPHRITVRLPEHWHGAVEWSLTLAGCDERDDVHWAHTGEGTVQDGALELPFDRVREIGYYTVHLHVRGVDGEREAEQSLIVAPEHCVTPNERLDGHRVWGIVANLYTVRSLRNWGVGDFTDLSELLAWAGEVGAAFVGLNPLHATWNRAGEVSPYSPVSRIYRNPIYLDVTAVPELAESDEARRVMESDDFRAELARLRASDRVDYPAVMALKRRVLEPLHATFLERHGDAETDRGRAYRDYLAREGAALERFATFVALDEHFRAMPDGPAWWREWPSGYCDPDSVTVREFRGQHHAAVEYHRWLQFEIDRQLAGCAARAGLAGLPLGIYQDLAIGTSANSADMWSQETLFAQGVSLGAPPDMYAQQGQNWGLPPLDPLALRADAYRYWIHLLRSAMRHAGALRIDHALGLFRQFWIPQGKSGEDGAYVRFPVHDLLGILALESARANALVVGEDLGNVPHEVPPTLKDWGVLGSKVLYFERDEQGGFNPPERYEPLSLTTANTHDMATISGWWQARDIALRNEFGLVTGDDYRRDLEMREHERRALVQRLRDAHVPVTDAVRQGDAELRGAMHEFLRHTPAALVGISLDDLVGEIEPVNLPGVGPDQFPSWTRREHVPVEEYRTRPEVARALPRTREPLA